MRELINQYWDLPASSRQEVEQYVKDHPELAPELERAKAIATLIDDVLSQDVDEEDVARLVSMDVLGSVAGLSDAEKESIAAAIDSQRGLATLSEAYSKKAAELSVHDPIAHYETLRQRTGAEAHTEATTSERAPVQHGRQNMRLLRLPRLALAAVFALLALVVSLVVIDAATTSSLERKAYFLTDEVNRSHYDFTTRSLDQMVNSDNASFLKALDLIQQSEHSYFGLFKSYDEGALGQAEVALRDYINSRQEETFLSLEARYLLAKIMIHEGRLSPAENELNIVVEEGGARASRAQRLLEEIEKTY